MSHVAYMVQHLHQALKETAPNSPIYSSGSRIDTACPGWANSNALFYKGYFGVLSTTLVVSHRHSL